MATPWVHSFSVTDPQLYDNKFTIYRITSLIFPANQPGALSCITIWKRYSEVKDLYQKLVKAVKLKELPIRLPDVGSRKLQYFHRFHPNVIEARRQWILDLLELIGNEPALYSSDVFTKFLQTGYVPRRHQEDVVDGAIKSSLLSDNKENWRRSSETSEDPSSNSLAEDQMSVASLASSQVSTASGVKPRFSADYVVEATERFNEAVQLEVGERYKEAFACYKDGIEVLMAGIPNDPDKMRQKMAKEKVQKYLTRTENIHDLFLKQPEAGVELNGEQVKDRLATQELPLNQLARYRVIRVMDNNVMSVQELTTRRFFIIKSIDRTEDWKGSIMNDNLNMMYMVHLVAYFVAECVIFLLLQPAR